MERFILSIKYLTPFTHPGLQGLHFFGPSDVNLGIDWRFFLPAFLHILLFWGMYIFLTEFFWRVWGWTSIQTWTKQGHWTPFRGYYYILIWMHTFGAFRFIFFRSQGYLLSCFWTKALGFFHFCASVPPPPPTQGSYICFMQTFQSKPQCLISSHNFNFHCVKCPAFLPSRFLRPIFIIVVWRSSTTKRSLIRLFSPRKVFV